MTRDHRYIKDYTVYVVQNLITKKLYIGLTQQLLHNRWVKHCSSAKRYDGSSYSKLHMSIKKYGRDAFHIQALKSVSTLEEANKYETLLISVYDTIKKGYNTSPGGSLLSPEMRAKMRLAHLGKKLPPHQVQDLRVRMKGNTFAKGSVRSPADRKVRSESAKKAIKSMQISDPQKRAAWIQNIQITELHSTKRKKMNGKEPASKYRGISMTNGYYQARKVFQKKNYYFGTFKTEEEAYTALQKGLQELKEMLSQSKSQHNTDGSSQERKEHQSQEPIS